MVQCALSIYAPCNCLLILLHQGQCTSCKSPITVLTSQWFHPSPNAQINHRDQSFDDILGSKGKPVTVEPEPQLGLRYSLLVLRRKCHLVSRAICENSSIFRYNSVERLRREFT